MTIGKVKIGVSGSNGEFIECDPKKHTGISLEKRVEHLENKVQELVKQFCYDEENPKHTNKSGVVSGGIITNSKTIGGSGFKCLKVKSDKPKCFGTTKNDEDCENCEYNGDECAKAAGVSKINAPFYAMAHRLNRDLPEGSEKTMALRKLIEAKDCAVRAAI